MKKRSLLLLLCCTLLILTACKSEMNLSPGGTGSGKGDGQTPPAVSGQSESSVPQTTVNPLIIGTNIGLSDIESVSLGRLFETVEQMYTAGIDQEGYYLTAMFTDDNGPHQVDTAITQAEWDSILQRLNGIKLVDPAQPEEDITVLDGEEFWLNVHWRGENPSDPVRTAGLGDDEWEPLFRFFREIALRYELPAVRKGPSIGDVETFTFSAGRIAHHVSYDVNFSGVGRQMDFTYDGEDLAAEGGSSYMTISGTDKLRQEDVNALWALLQGCTLREEEMEIDESYHCTLKMKDRDAIYSVDLSMTTADALVSWFQQIRLSHREPPIPARAALDQIHGVSLLAALDGAKRVDLISAWGAPDSGIQASSADVWYLTDTRQIEVYYAEDNGQVYDVFVTEREYN